MGLRKLFKTIRLIKLFGIVSLASALLGTGFFVFSAKRSANNTYYELGQLVLHIPGKTTKLATTPQKEPTPVTSDPQPTTTTKTNPQKQTATNTQPSGYNPNAPRPAVTITASSITYDVIPDSYCNIKVRSTMTSNQAGTWSVLFKFSPEGGNSESVASYPSFTAGQPVVVEKNWQAITSPYTNRVSVSISVSPLSGSPQQVNFTPPAPVTIDC